MKILSNQIICQYNFKKTKDNVDLYMHNFEEEYYRYSSVLPPSITSHISEIKTNSTTSITSCIEKFVEKKIEIEKLFLEKLDKIINTVDSFTYEERYYFKGTYFLGIAELELQEVLKCAGTKLLHIKRSSILKFALALNLAIRK